MSESPIEPEPEASDPEASLLDELLSGIPALLHRIEDTENAVAMLVEELSDYPAGGPWLWDGLEPEAQRELWVELDAFVSWLQNRILCHHAAKEGWIAPCWYRHPDAVEQLTALMVAHKASYRPKTKTPSHSLADWFHRYLWPTMDTLKQRQTFKECLSKKKHEEPYMLGLNLEAGTADFTAFVDANVTETPAEDNPGSKPSSDEGQATGLPPWMVNQETGELLEPPLEDEPPEPVGEYDQHGQG